MAVRHMIPLVLCLAGAGSVEAQQTVSVSATIVDRVVASAPDVEVTAAGEIVVGAGSAGAAGTVLLESTWVSVAEPAPVSGGSVAMWRQAGAGFRLEAGVGGERSAAPAEAGLPGGYRLPLQGDASRATLTPGPGRMVVTRIIASNS